MTRPPGTRPGSMRSRPTRLTHKGCHARVAAHRRPAEAHCPSRSSALRRNYGLRALPIANKRYSQRVTHPPPPRSYSIMDIYLSVLETRTDVSLSAACLFEFTMLVESRYR